MMKALGDALRLQGLTPRALAAWAGTDRVSALAGRLDAHAAREPVPAATVLAMFVAGAEVAAARVRNVDALVDAGLAERRGDRVRATVAILPVGGALVVCDRDDAEDTRDLVCWPDDSSYHLAGALGSTRRATWLDLGTGSAFAPLVRPELATRITGVDLNPRAVRFARLGAGLSGITHVDAVEGDVAAAVGPAELVSCNAPIPDEYDAAIWRSADDAFFRRLWPAARAALAPGGEVVVHARLDAIPQDLPGARRIVVYTPPTSTAFAVLWWRPDAGAEHVVVRRELTPSRPHVDVGDR